MSGRAPRILLLAVLACPAAAQPWVEFLRTPILTDDDRRSMMFSYVDQHLPPIAMPETEQQRRALRDRILKVVGLEDLERRGLVRWISKSRIERDTYRIEKILIETYPGMMVPALVYVPRNLAGTAPAMISIP